MGKTTDALSGPTTMMGRMTITMQNFALTWIDPDDVRPLRRSHSGDPG